MQTLTPHRLDGPLPLFPGERRKHQSILYGTKEAYQAAVEQHRREQVLTIRRAIRDTKKQKVPA